MPPLVASYLLGRDGEIVIAIVIAMAKRVAKGRAEGTLVDRGLEAETGRQTLLRVLAEEEAATDRRPRWRRLKVLLKRLQPGRRASGAHPRRPT